MQTIKIKRKKERKKKSPHTKCYLTHRSLRFGPRCKHTVPRRMCRKAQVKKREKIKELLTAEPHPALNQWKNERQREAKRKSQWGEETEAKTQRTETIKKHEKLNKRGKKLNEEGDISHEFPLHEFLLWFTTWQTTEALTNHHRQTVKGFGCQKIVMDALFPAVCIYIGPATQHTGPGDGAVFRQGCSGALTCCGLLGMYGSMVDTWNMTSYPW